MHAVHSSFVVPLILALVKFSTATPGQDAAPTFRSNARLILLDVVVTDRAGHPVRGLDRTNFTILEDGVAQQMRSFEGSTPLGSSVNSKSNSARTVILLDQLNVQFQDLAFARDRLAIFFKSGASERQPTALMSIGRHGLVMVQDFTADSGKLLNALAHLPAYSANPSDGYADPVLAGEHARESLRSLAQIARASVGYPFRLNVIWVTSGFSGLMTSAAVSGEVEAGLRRVANLLIRSRMSLYTIDPAGVIQESSSVSIKPVDRTKFGSMQAASQQFTPGIANQQLSGDKFLADLTRLMGGVSFYNRNDVELAVTKAIEDGSSSYAMTYSPANAEFKGNYRKIEIRTNVEGTTARTRPGYYATSEETPDKASRDDRLKVAMDSPIPYAAFQSTCALTYETATRRAAGKLTSSPQPGMGGSEETQQIILATAFSDADKFLNKWSWQIDWKTPWTTRSVSTMFDRILPPGTSRVHFIVSDSSAERIGTCDFQVPR